MPQTLYYVFSDFEWNIQNVLSVGCTNVLLSDLNALLRKKLKSVPSNLEKFASLAQLLFLFLLSFYLFLLKWPKAFSDFKKLIENMLFTFFWMLSLA